MATYKRKSMKTGANSRRTTTSSSKGTYTASTSRKAGNQRMTYTQKGNGQSYTTITSRMADGSYSRKRVTSSSPKTKSKNMDNTGGGMLIILLMVAASVFVALFQ